MAAAGAAPGNEQGVHLPRMLVFSTNIDNGQGRGLRSWPEETSTDQGEGDGKSQIFGVRGVS